MGMGFFLKVIGLWAATTLTLTAQTFDILDYDAVGDGHTLCTAAIQSAIDECRDQGGGTVLIPAGTYLTGTLRVYSHMRLQVAPGATLLGSSRLEDYDPDHPHLIWGDRLQHFRLGGDGIIDGQGEAFFDQSGRSWKAEDGARPHPWIRISRGRDIRVEDLNLINSPAHVLVFKRCEDLVVRGVTIRNDLRSPNTDGIDLKGCRRVLISDCLISTGDDAICLKSAIDTVEQVVVSDCILISDDAAIKFGTGSRYPIRHCQFSNISISGTRYGISFFMTQGGVYEHCQFSNILIETSSRHQTEYPIYMDIDKRSADQELGMIRDMDFTNIKIITRGNILIGGQAGQPITGLRFDGLTMALPELTDLTEVAKKPRGNKSFPTLPGMADFSAVPAHFTLGHVADVKLSNIRIDHQFTASPYPRHFFHFQEAERVQLSGLQLLPPMPGHEAIHQLGHVSLVVE
jgi:polygalacturonase